MNRSEFIGDVFTAVAAQLIVTGLLMVETFVFELQEYNLDTCALRFFMCLASALYLNYLPCDGILKTVLWNLSGSTCGGTFAVLSVVFPIHPTLTAALLTAAIIFAFGGIVVRTKADLTTLHSVRWQMQKIALGAGILATIRDSKIVTVCVVIYVFHLYLFFVLCDIQMTLKTGYQKGYNTTQKVLAVFELYFDIIILFFIISWTLANI